HTYCHDLESFLYVLIWVCTSDGNVDKWRQGTTIGIAALKAGQMTMTEIFEKLLDAFHPTAEGLKDVARAWRKVLIRTG
ncbi:hypothetical protein DFH27DRAFT_473733, partial [Peziza echinospora]